MKIVVCWSLAGASHVTNYTSKPDDIKHLSFPDNNDFANNVGQLKMNITHFSFAMLITASY